VSSHSRLGKGLGTLFPTLQQDQAKPKPNSLFPTIPLAGDVSRETSSATASTEKAASSQEPEAAKIVSATASVDVSRETSVGNSQGAVSGAADNARDKRSDVSRETLAGNSQGSRSAFEKGHQKSARPKIPSLMDSLHPADLFFDLGDDEPPVHRGARDDGAGAPAKSSTSGEKTAGATVDKALGDSAKSTVADVSHVGTAEDKSAAKEQAASGQDGQVAVHSSSPAAEDEFKPLDGAYYTELPLDSIAPNEHQPRTIFDEDELRELADSIKEVGVLEPVVVRKRENWTAPYELIMGERRLRAAKIAGTDAIPALIRTTSDEDMLRDAVLENLHRVALNPLEEAAAYQQMIDDFHITQAELAQSVSKSRSQITNTLRLLQLPATVQKKVAAGVLSAGHARALLALTDVKQMEPLANRIIAEGLSVRSTEEIVAMKNGAETKQHRQAKPSIWQGSDELKRLEDRFETKVDIRGTRKKGKIEITFSSEEDLARIMNLIGAQDESGADSDNGWV
jgi:ParB family chromosome partitioning protein